MWLLREAGRGSLGYNCVMGFEEWLEVRRWLYGWWWLEVTVGLSIGISGWRWFLGLCDVLVYEYLGLGIGSNVFM